MTKFRPPMSEGAAQIFERLLRDVRRADVAIENGDLWGLASLAELLVSHAAKPTSAKASSIRGYLAEYGLTPSVRVKRKPTPVDEPPANPMAGL